MAMPSTFMIKNLPSRWSTAQVLEVINELGFDDTFDFFYMPRRSASPKAQALGYAFINFRDSGVGQIFQEDVSNGLLMLRDRVASVTTASIQGLENLNMHFEAKRTKVGRDRKACGGDTSAEPVTFLREDSTTVLAPTAPTPAVPQSPELCTSGVTKVKPSAGGRRWADIVDDDEENFEEQSPVWCCSLRAAKGSTRFQSSLRRLRQE
eukprot:TRINITY_DN14272_c0_g1_i4.p1 TRINITY_DN14272_c0_g1~~TRINITY_DN14272_c0_g1_i4.p1  ORF type:complete len:208 (+),score=46.93 TRINITY_DN14272_c0_g1_i4:71-694(+)